MEAWHKAGVPLEAVLEGDRQGVRKLSAIAAGSGQAAEELGVLYGCGVGGSGRATGSGCRERAEEWTRGSGRDIFEGRIERILREKWGKAAASGGNERRYLSGDGGTVDGNCEVAGSKRYATGCTGEIGFGRPGEAADDPGRQNAAALTSHAPEEMMLKIRREWMGNWRRTGAR